MRPSGSACPVLLLVLAAASCAVGSGESAAQSSWESEVSTQGDVTTVRTISGSVWGGIATLKEELSIGVESGDRGYMFGQVQALAEHYDELFVLDQQMQAVRVYDLQGRHLRDLGKEGQGPGEMKRPESMVIGQDGRIWLRDPPNGRIMILRPDGTEAGVVKIRSGFSTAIPMVMTADGTLYNSQLLDPEALMTEWVTGYVPLSEDESMTGDPITPPDFDLEPATLEARRGGSMSTAVVPFTGTTVWTLSPKGVQAAGVSSDYSFDLLHPGGRVFRVIKSWEPVPVLPEEADYHRKRITANMKNTDPDWTWDGPPIPDRKPAYSTFVPDHAGRIWISRPGAGSRAVAGCVEDPMTANVRVSVANACWQSETIWEIFDDEGRFLGGIEIPEGVQMFPRPFISENHYLAAFMDEYGTPMVKRYRIVRPSG